jgi:hypothetical protein
MALANLALPDGLVGHLAACERPMRPVVRRITT